jgi:hypothetical protein
VSGKDKVVADSSTHTEKGYIGVFTATDNNFSDVIGCMVDDISSFL